MITINKIPNIILGLLTFIVLALPSLCSEDSSKKEAWAKAQEAKINKDNPKGPDTKIGAELADYYIEKGDLEKAVVYAEIAFTYGASHGFRTLLAAHEMRGDLDKAEEVVARNAQRWGQHFAYLSWALRTEHGDPKAILKNARADYERRGERYSREWGMTEYLAGNNKKAQELFEVWSKQASDKASPFLFMMLGMVEHSLGNEAGMKKALELCVQKGFVRRNADKRCKEIATWYLSADLKETKAVPEGLVVKSMKGVDYITKAEIYLIFGRIAQNLGNSEQAIGFYKKAINQVPLHKTHYIIPRNMATIWLRTIQK